MEKKTIIAAMLSAVALSSCKDFKATMNTSICEDGSCSREIVVGAEHILNHAYNDTLAHQSPLQAADSLLRNHCWLHQVADNDLWQKTWTTSRDSLQGQWPMTPDEFASFKSQRSNPNDSVMLRAVRHFANVQEMAEAFPLAVSGRQITTHCSLEKRFRWFYTEYTFTETFQSQSSLFNVSPSEFFTDDEWAYLTLGTPNIYDGYRGFEVLSNAEDKSCLLQAYLNANDLSLAIRYLEEHYDEIPNAPMDKQQFLEEAKRCISKSNYRALAKHENLDALTACVGSDVYARFLQNQQQFKDIESNYDSKTADLAAIDVDYVLNMPGGLYVLTDDCKGYLKDGELHFNLSVFELLANDYTICATSKSRNIWAFVVSILIGVMAIGLTVASYRRK